VLVGTGVRKVSFLAIKVYAVGFYVSEKELEAAKAGKLEGWKVSRTSSISQSETDEDVLLALAGIYS
jgi:hypothetical protein